MPRKRKLLKTVEAYCLKRREHWVRNDSSLTKIEWLLERLYGLDEEVMAATNLHTRLEGTGVDYIEIDELFGVRVGNLLRQMSAIVEVGGENEEGTKNSKRIVNAGEEAKNIILACAIEGVERALVSVGRTSAQSNVSALNKLLEAMDGANKGLVDLAEQIVELESR